MANVAKCTLVSLQFTRLSHFTEDFHGEECLQVCLISYLNGKVSNVLPVKYDVCHSFL